MLELSLVSLVSLISLEEAKGGHAHSVRPTSKDDFQKDSLAQTNKKLVIVASICSFGGGASWHTFRSFFGTPFCIDF